MADNVNVTGDGAIPVATDDVGGVQYQRMKLVTAEDGSAEPIGDTDLGTSRALWIDARVAAVPIPVASAGLTTATTAYTSGDQLGTIFTFAGAARAAGLGGRLDTVILVDKADILASVDLVLFNQSVTLAGDNSPFAISDADALLSRGIIGLDCLDIGNNRVATLSNVGLRYDCLATSLFGSLITRSAHTFFTAVTDIQVLLQVVRD